MPKLPFESQGAPTESQRRPKMVPKGAQGAQREPKGLRKEAQSRPKCPQSLHLSPREPQQGRKGNPKWSQGEPKDPKGSPQGVKGTPREDNIAHRRSKIAEIYENTTAFHYFLKSQRARILEMCVSRRRNDYLFGKLAFRVHEPPTFLGVDFERWARGLRGVGLSSTAPAYKI